MTGRPRILVIEDDEVLAAFVAQVLQDYDVTLASSGEQGVELSLSGRFDLAICDLMLPGINGFEVMRELRCRQPEARLMVMSAHSERENMLATLHQNVVDFIVKPFLPEDLLAAVENLLKCELAIEVVSATPQWIELQMPASFQVAASLNRFLAHFQADIDEETRAMVGSAFEELVNNAIEHGAKGDCRQKIRISYVRLERAIIYRIEDPGAGFDMRSLPHAAISYPDDPSRHARIREEKGLRPGGFGLLCVRSLADEVIYDERRNKVMFVKYLD